TLNTVINDINAANVGVAASVNSVGQLQLTTVQTGGQNVPHPPVSIDVTAASGDFAAGPGSLAPLATGPTTGLDNGFPPSALVTVALANTPNTVMKDLFGDPTGVAFPAPTQLSNINQFFFQGTPQSLATQVLAASDVSPLLPIGGGGSYSGASLVQPQSPAQLKLALIGAAFAPGDLAAFDVTGVDAVTGQTVTDTLRFTGNGVQTSTHFFRSISSISLSTDPTAVTTATVTHAQIQAVADEATTQADTAGAMAVDANILKDPSLIAASSTPDAPGNQTNALALLNVQQQDIMSSGQVATTWGDFYSTAINELGDAASSTHTNRLTTEQLVQNLQNQKQSIVGVSLDQEAANLVALQNAYQAAARAITTQDQMLATIITGMGVVGLAGG
ncbi:MAG TPA: flagellar basal body rod C-terminal domain-containing protein, partial [Chloroflexota bacterium]|nr:flagellar basal body rod C-terminal domain-containing protein [Chloroflexota bacterium]